MPTRPGQLSYNPSEADMRREWGVKDTLVAGISNETNHTVTKAMSPVHLPIVVLSTPTMIGLIEGTCLNSVAGHLDEGETTVGTHVCVSHEAAVREGEQFVITSRLTSIDRRRLKFDVEVEGPSGTVSRGTHERAVVQLQRMAGR
jgi:predicted thioesterase